MRKIKLTIRRLVFHLVLLLAIYCLCRGIFLFTNRVEFNFPTLFTAPYLLFAGIRFDLAAIFMTNALFILLNILPAPFIANSSYQKGITYLFIISNSFFIFLNIVDIAYFPYTHKRMQSDVILFLNGKKGKTSITYSPTSLNNIGIYCWFMLH